MEQSCEYGIVSEGCGTKEKYSNHLKHGTPGEFPFFFQCSHNGLAINSITFHIMSLLPVT